MQDPGEFGMVVGMDVAVDQIFGVVLVDKAYKAFKATVGVVLPVAVTLGGRMGDDNIHPFGPADLKP